MKTDYSIFKTKKHTADILCVYDKNNVHCFCYFNSAEFNKHLEMLIRNKGTFNAYSVNLYFKQYADITSNKPVRLTDIPQSFYDGKNVEVEIVY